MSLCLVSQTKDQIIIAADSRSSIQFNGEYLANGDDVPKLFHIGDRVLFSAGSQWVALEVIRRYKDSLDMSIDALNEIGKVVVSDFERLFPDAAAEFPRKFEMVVACFENGNSVIYSLSSYENYNIIRIEGGEKRIIAAIGHRRPDAMQYLNTLFEIPILPLYQMIYDQLSDEQMGGSLTIYVLSERGVEFSKTTKIKDSRPIKFSVCNENGTCSIGPEDGYKCTLSDNSARAIFNATALKMQVSTDGGQTWEDKLYFDPVAGKYKFVGDIEVTDGSITWAKLNDDVESAVTTISQDEISTATIKLNQLTSLNEDPYILLFNDSISGPAIDATAADMQGQGDAIRFKWNRRNYVLVKDDEIAFYVGGLARGYIDKDGYHDVTANLGVVLAELAYESADTTTDGTKITLDFNQDMADPDGKHSQFSCTVAGSSRSITAAALNADTTKIDLTLASAVAYGETVTISYTQGTVESENGELLESFTNQSVTNNVPAGYQEWSGYPNSPITTASYPYQFINIVSGTTYLVGSSSSPWYRSNSSYASSGETKVYYYLSGGAWVYGGTIADTWGSGTLLQSNYDIYSSSGLTIVFFPKNTDTTYQEWSSYPDSPLLTTDYPIQVVTVLGTSTYLIMCKDKPLYYTGTYLVPFVTPIKYSLLSGGSWGTPTDFSGNWGGTGMTIPECNHNIFNESTYSTVYKTKTTT